MFTKEELLVIEDALNIADEKYIIECILKGEFEVL